jgi:hypothetical protein
VGFLVRINAASGGYVASMGGVCIANRLEGHAGQGTNVLNAYEYVLLLE